MPESPNIKVLLIRNDKIGDFMLAWPAFALLKKQYPDAEITALVPAYTAPLAEQCEWIDKILIDEKKPGFFRDIITLRNKLRSQRYDVSISLFSQSRTALALLLAGIRYRLGPATKIAQLFLNHRLRQKRSQSAKPEYEYNIDLIKHFITNRGDTAVSVPEPPYLRFDAADISTLKQDFRKKHAIDENCKLVFIHPGTGGSAINLSLQQFAELAKFIATDNNIYFVVTAGPDELPQAEELSSRLPDIDHYIHHSRGSIIDFCKFISICDLFISGSTGPLHIAGALNINTVAFYPARRSATSLRWQTINSNTKRLDFSPDKHIDDLDMNRIDIQATADIIIDKFINPPQKNHS